VFEERFHIFKMSVSYLTCHPDPFVANILFVFTPHTFFYCPSSQPLDNWMLLIYRMLANTFRHWGLKDIDVTVSLISKSAVLLVSRGRWVRLAASPVFTDAWKNHPKIYKYLLCTGKVYFLRCFFEPVELCVLYLNDHTHFQNLWKKTKVMDIVLHDSGSSGLWVFLSIFPKASVLLIIFLSLDDTSSCQT